MFVDTNRPLNRECGRLNRQTWTGLVKKLKLKSMPLFIMFKLLPLIYVVVVDRFIYIYITFDVRVYSVFMVENPNRNSIISTAKGVKLHS